MGADVGELRAWARVEMEVVMLSALGKFLCDYPRVPDEDILSAIHAVGDRVQGSVESLRKAATHCYGCDSEVCSDRETGEYVTFAELSRRYEAREKGPGYVRPDVAALEVFGEQDSRPEGGTSSS